MNDEQEILQFTAEAAGERLDSFLAERAGGLTRSFIQNLIKQGCAEIDGKTAKANARLKPGSTVTLTLPPVEAADLKPQPIPLDIVYQDADIIVVNKARGMVVHPAAGNPDGTLVNALLYWVEDLAGVGGELRPGIVHRIDKDTTGLLVVAKNDAALHSLAEQIKQKTARRTYLAILDGTPKEPCGRVCAPIGRHPRDRKKMAVTPSGREAATNYRVLERYPGHSLVECTLETGRTHQIRVHMAYIGHPVTGDPLYGRQKNDLGLPAQALHAYKLELTHPTSGERMTFCAPPPADFLRALQKLSGGSLPEFLQPGAMGKGET